MRFNGTSYMISNLFAVRKLEEWEVARGGGGGGDVVLLCLKGGMQPFVELWSPHS